MRRNTQRIALLATVTGSALAASGCDAVKDALAQLGAENKTGPRQVTDENAFNYLLKDRAAVPETDTKSVDKLIDAQAAAAAGQKQSVALDAASVKLLKSVVASRRVIKTDQLKEIAEQASVESFLPDKSARRYKAACDNEIDFAQLKEDSYLIPGIEKIPVRDQKYRGTCAAFAGIGAVEYAALNGTKPAPGGNPSLETLDLSEQRFYWMSKPECQASGACGLPGAGEGSWYGTGFDASKSAAADGSLTIPYESSCEYNPMPTDFDTQSPQPSTCADGKVAVTGVGTWCGLGGIIKFLNEGYAVPYASPLTKNWENNDGLVTASDLEAGDTGHAGGHAYLIVGYKKLPEGTPASEGGLCFVIKNSWGTGWGAGGYSCMTVGWMKKVTFDGFFEWDQPVPVEVLLAEELQQQSLPPEPEPEPIPEDEVVPEIPEEDALPADDEEERLDPLPPDLDPNGDIVKEEDTGEDTGAGGSAGEDVPGIVPEPTEAFTAVRLLGPGRAYYKVTVAEVGNELRIKGALKTGGETAQLRTVLQGNKLLYKGDVVGEYLADKGTMTLCTEDYEPICGLRYRKTGKVMYIAFKDEDLRTVKADETVGEKGSWQDINLSGKSYGIFIPSNIASTDFLFNPKTFVRVNGGEPSRLGLRTQKSGLGAFALSLSGMTIGEVDFTDPTLPCTGKYEKVCSTVGGDKLDVIPSNKRKL